MRNILFRGKAINRTGNERTKYKNGDWVYGLFSRSYNKRWESPAEMTNEDGISNIEVDYKTIGQYTGLSDMYGFRIFEGDIIQNNYENFTATIKCLNNLNEMVAETNNGGILDLSSLNSKNIEIIGNIYE